MSEPGMAAQPDKTHAITVVPTQNPNSPMAPESPMRASLVVSS